MSQTLRMMLCFVSVGISHFFLVSSACSYEQPSTQLGSTELNLMLERYDDTGDGSNLIMMVILDAQQHSQARAGALRSLLGSRIEGTQERLYIALASFYRDGLESVAAAELEAFASSHSTIALSAAMHLVHAWDEMTDAQQASGMRFFDAVIRDETVGWFGPSVPTKMVQTVLGYDQDPALRSRVAFASVSSLRNINDWTIYLAGKAVLPLEQEAALAQLGAKSSSPQSESSRVRRWIIMASGIGVGAHQELADSAQQLLNISLEVNLGEREQRTSDALYRLAQRLADALDPATAPSDAMIALAERGDVPIAIEIDILLERGLAVSSARATLQQCEMRLREQYHAELASHSKGQLTREQIVPIVYAKFRPLYSLIDDFE